MNAVEQRVQSAKLAKAFLTVCFSSADTAEPASSSDVDTAKFLKPILKMKRSTVPLFDGRLWPFRFRVVQLEICSMSFSVWS